MSTGCSCETICGCGTVLTVSRGTPRTMRIRLPDVADITGYHFILTVKTKKHALQDDDSDTYALFQKIITIITDPTAVGGGFTDVLLTEADLDHLAGSYVYDIVSIDPLGTPRRSELKPFIILPRGGQVVT